MEEANLNPSNMQLPIETGKVFNLRYLLTTLLVVIIVLFVLSKIVKQQIILYDKSGAESGKGEVKFSFVKMKK